MKKVSIIIPCYNSEKYVDRLINSILNQTYKNLEVIFVNDGSNDKTEKIIMRYEKCFSNNNMEFKYLVKENGGQASALNKGLEIFTGEYLCWPDSDDFFLKDSIKEKVEFLEKHTYYSMVRTNSYVCSEDNLLNPIGQICAEIGAENYKENLFDEFILEKKVWYAPITFLIKSSVFLEVYPKRQIYVSEGSGSQNFQMLVPISLNNKWGYLDKKLSVYTFRKNSYSRQWNNLEKILIRYFYHEKILKEVISNENLFVDQIRYKKIIEIKYIRKRMQAAFKWGDKKKVKNEYENLKALKAINISDRIFYIKSLFPFMRFQYYILDFLKQKIKMKKYNKISLKKQLEELNIIN